MLILTRKEATSLGLKRYYTNKPCKYGHIDERRVHDGACCECQRICYREYSALNKDKEQDRKRIDMQNRRDQKTPTETIVFNKEHYKKYAYGYKARARQRISRCSKATPPWVDMVEISKVYKNCPKGYHVDHIIPLAGITEDGRQVSGLHVLWNLQYLPALDNIKKSNLASRSDLNEIT